MLTLKKLKAMKPNTIFVFKAGSNGQRTFMFVAKRGVIHDWAIYTSLNAVPMRDFWAGDKVGIAAHGEKVMSKEMIQNLVPCDNEALEMYRY